MKLSSRGKKMATSNQNRRMSANARQEQKRAYGPQI